MQTYLAESGWDDAAHPGGRRPPRPRRTQSNEGTKRRRARAGIGLSLGVQPLAPSIKHAIWVHVSPTPFCRYPEKGRSDWEYSWIPVVAPIVGGVLGGGAHFLIGF